LRHIAADGLEAWGQVIERGYEGYVAKDEASAYEGGRTKQRDWTIEENRWRQRLNAAPPVA